MDNILYSDNNFSLVPFTKKIKATLKAIAKKT